NTLVLGLGSLDPSPSWSDCSPIPVIPGLTAAQFPSSWPSWCLTQDTDHRDLAKLVTEITEMTWEEMEV
ncbi:MAG: hypothetical protein KAY24_15935, partial [Candidatus Eisenbacteria sp.]|nr:hypothetical protein [Candidatus Eisenbacteria bacterium]